MISAMEVLTLQRRFRPWRYGVSHSELLMHGHADANGDEHINVLFEDVRAVKLRTFYDPLVLQPADEQTRLSILDFAQVPARFHARFLCLTLPTPDAEPGFIACARATVLSTSTDRAGIYDWTDRSRVLHDLRPIEPRDPHSTEGAR
ncbi:hypothetical protein SAMN04489712_13045 [Thermomonospora echinospora]|uniref:Uncharacterized protein n=1 Tax=Thermomonospora echinospora TaxID=1992 RepID=A0A1H6E262_9ACTN|nr:hypothetical protein [Thermomonospora echinospora]SEG91768.1 hypothetical protein SAMN04489712_13045 [Thermomonospora echinospora]